MTPHRQNSNSTDTGKANEHPFARIHPATLSLEQINQRSQGTLMGNLGIKYTVVEVGRVEALMPVDDRTKQPVGILHGGASLALAETLAGMGSMLLCEPEDTTVGMQVSGNHVSSALEGDTVRGVATVIHRGRTTHVWNVDVFTSAGTLVSSIRVVNYVVKRK